MASGKETLSAVGEKAGIKSDGPRGDYEAPGPNTYDEDKGVDDPKVVKRPNGDVLFHWGDPVGWDMIMGVRGLRRDKEELWGLIEVQFRSRPEAKKRNLLSEQRINFRSGSSKTNVYRALERRHKGMMWEERVEWIAKYIQDQLRAGITPVKIADVQEVGAAEFVVWPFLEKNEVCTIYGDGGSTKSLLSQLLALSVAHGIAHVPGSKVSEVCDVLIVDYETNPATARRRLRMLAQGHGIPDEVLTRIHYVAVADPIYEVSSELGRMIRELKIGLAIVDSASAATQGGVSDESETMRYFNSIRTWGTTVLTIAHVPKESKIRGPAGVKQWENQSRNTYEIVIDDDDGSNFAHVAMLHRKTNNDRKQRPTGFAIDFSGGKILYMEESASQTLDGNRSSSLTNPDRIRMELEEADLLTSREIAEALEIKPQAVDKVLNRWLKAGEVLRTDTRPAQWSLNRNTLPGVDQAARPYKEGDEDVEDLNF